MPWRKYPEDTINTATRSFGLDFNARVAKPRGEEARWRGSITVWGRVVVQIFGASELVVKRRLSRILLRWAGDIRRELGKDGA